MTPSQLRAELIADLKDPAIAEPLFDCLSDVVFFVKNRRCEYVVVNQSLVKRCGRREKRELLGRRADELFPAPLGESYRAQDENVLRSGRSILNQLELHFYPSGGRGWCLTNKLPLAGKNGSVAGVIGFSRDLQAAGERGQDYAAVAQAVHYIDQHLDESLRVSDLAERVGLSVYQFEERIRRLFQITAGQLIQKTRMEAAVRRLRESRDPIAAIALDCGYSDQSAFTRQFKKTVGISPSEYRIGESV